MHAYINALRNYFVIRGRTSYRDFWMFILVNIIIFILLIATSLIISIYSTAFAVAVLLIPWFLYVIFITIPSFTIQIRRLHDVGKSGWWYFINFVPLFGQLYFLILILRKGDESKNEYGEPPGERVTPTNWRKIVTVFMFVLFSAAIILFFIFGIKDLIQSDKHDKAQVVVNDVNEANVIMNRKDISKSNFVEFWSNIDHTDLTLMENGINTKQYDSRSYYEMFNELYFKFHWKDNTEINKCINNNETSECSYYNAILNNNEKLCETFPTVRKVASPGKYGTSYFDTYYKLSCIFNTRMLANYKSQPDKITFCKSFEEQYIQKQCLVYTCESYYWNSAKPAECTAENINYWMGIN